MARTKGQIEQLNKDFARMKAEKEEKEKAAAEKETADDIIRRTGTEEEKATVDLSDDSKSVLADIKAGKLLLGKDFEEGSLGRAQEARSGNIDAVIAARKAALGGLTAEENQALRERGKQGIKRGVQTSLRQLRGIQGASGVRGASAASQQANILMAGQAAGANVERDLFLKNIEAKRAALGDFETSVRSAESEEVERQRANIDLGSREKFGRLAAGLGFSALGVAERSGTKAADAARASGGGGGGKK